MDPRPTTPTGELEQESPQERLDRERGPEADNPEVRASTRICEALRQAGALRHEALVKAVAYEGDPEEWKRRLWRLHNEGYVKVRWVGLADPDPVEVRLGQRGWELLSHLEADPAAVTSETPDDPSRTQGQAAG